MAGRAGSPEWVAVLVFAGLVFAFWRLVKGKAETGLGG